VLRYLTIILFLIFLCITNKAECQIVDSIGIDSTLNKFILKYASIGQEKTIILKFYYLNAILAKAQVSKSKQISSVDSIYFYEPYTRDSLIYGKGIRRAEIIDNFNFGADTPVTKSSIIMPHYDQKDSTKLLLKNSINDYKKQLFKNSINIVFTNEIEFGNNFYNGLNNKINPRVYNNVTINSTVIGIPINTSTNFTNLRNDNSLNFSDINLNIDVLKFKNELFNSNSITSKKLDQIKLNKNLTNIELQVLDSEINNLQNKVDNPFYLEKYQESKIKLEKLKLDTINSKNIDPNQINQIKFDIEKYEKEKEKLDKLKELSKFKVKEINSFDKDILDEKIDILKSKNLRKNLNTDSKLKGLNWLYSLNKFDFGRISPIYSDLTLNGLTYLGLNTQFNINKIEISLTGGRLNNYSSYLTNINSDLGGYLMASKISKATENSNKFISLLYYNPTEANNNEISNKYLIVGLGSNEKIFDKVNLKWEVAYSETDSIRYIKAKETKLFSNFNPYAIAGNFSISSELDSRSKFELTSRYVGFDFKNPASFNLRNDFLRNSFKINRLFNEAKTNLTYTIKYDVDNFTGLKSATTSIVNQNGLVSHKITKFLKLNLNVNYTKVITNSSLSKNVFGFESKLVMLSLIHIQKRKKLIQSNIFNLNFNSNESENNPSTSLYMATFNNSMDFFKSGFKVNSTFTTQSGTQDSTFGISLLMDLIKTYNKYDINIGANIKQNENIYSYKSAILGFSIKNKLLIFTSSFEYFVLKDIFGNNQINKNDLIFKTKIVIKI
jgi:hypothetical protein